jgi:hypothetical protein
MKYLTPKQHLRRLCFERFTTWLKYAGLSFMGAVAIGIVYVCLTSGNDVQKMNECLQKHNLDYCNKVVK